MEQHRSTAAMATNSAAPGYGGLAWGDNVFLFTTSAYNSTYGNTDTPSSGEEFIFNGVGVQSVTVSGGPMSQLSALLNTFA